MKIHKSDIMGINILIESGIRHTTNLDLKNTAEHILKKYVIFCAYESHSKKDHAAK
jgi:hypothetical protein